VGHIKHRDTSAVVLLVAWCDYDDRAISAWAPILGVIAVDDEKVAATDWLTVAAVWRNHLLQPLSNFHLAPRISMHAAPNPGDPPPAKRVGAEWRPSAIPFRTNPANKQRYFYIVNPFSGVAKRNGSSTHPPTEESARKLRSMSPRQGVGVMVGDLDYDRDSARFMRASSNSAPLQRFIFD